VAAERIDQFTRDGEAEAGAGSLGGEEGFEEAPGGVAGESGAVVEDAEEGAIAGGGHFEADDAVGEGADGLGGVAEEVEQDLFEELRVGLDGEGRGGGFKTQVGSVAQVEGMAAERLLDLGGADGTEGGLGRAGVEEQVLDELFEAGGLREDGRDKGGVGAVELFGQKLDEAFDGAEGVADFVGERGRHFAERGEVLEFELAAFGGGKAGGAADGEDCEHDDEETAEGDEPEMAEGGPDEEISGGFVDINAGDAEAAGGVEGDIGAEDGGVASTVSVRKSSRPSQRGSRKAGLAGRS
jgi:hypothetical protein